MASEYLVTVEDKPEKKEGEVAVIGHLPYCAICDGDWRSNRGEVMNFR